MVRRVGSEVDKERYPPLTVVQFRALCAELFINLLYLLRTAFDPFFSLRGEKSQKISQSATLDGVE